MGVWGGGRRGGEERRKLESRKWEVKMRGIGSAPNRLGELVKRFLPF